MRAAAGVATACVVVLLAACTGAPADGPADGATDGPADGGTSASGASGADGMTLEEHCATEQGVVDLTAVVDADDVALTWDDDGGRLGPATYWVARRDAPDVPWELVATVELAPSDERRYVHDAAADAPAEYTVAESDSCVTAPEQICAPDLPCPVVVLPPRGDD